MPIIYISRKLKIFDRNERSWRELLHAEAEPATTTWSPDAASLMHLPTLLKSLEVFDLAQTKDHLGYPKSEFWYHLGKKHRLDGPAEIVYFTGERNWFVDGIAVRNFNGKLLNIDELLEHIKQHPREAKVSIRIAESQKTIDAETARKMLLLDSLSDSA